MGTSYFQFFCVATLLYTLGYILWIPTGKHLVHIFRWSVLHSCSNMGALFSTCWADSWVRCWESGCMTRRRQTAWNSRQEGIPRPLSMPEPPGGGSQTISTHPGQTQPCQSFSISLQTCLCKFFLARVNFKIEYMSQITRHRNQVHWVTYDLDLSLWVMIFVFLWSW